MSVLNVKCPHCKQQFNYYSSESRPFCSERCKMIDLGLWLSESYAVPVKGPISEEDISEFEDNNEEDNENN